MNSPSELILYYQWLRRYGLNDSHSGNASLRIGDDLWVTPTGACADTLTEEDLVRCRLGAEPSPGASLDAALHTEVYRHNPKLGAVLHSHGPYSVAMTLSGEDFEPIDFEGQYYFKRVPVLTIPYERYLSDAPKQVGETLRRHPITVVRGHGVYAAALDLNLAYKWTCSLELSAKTAYIARTAGIVD
jgi:L-fuculose-phosphate aldolase